MKNTLLLMLLFTGIVNAQIVNIPDGNFKAYLVSSGLDQNFDGEIQVSEAEAAAGISIPSNVGDLTGIEAFTSISNFGCLNNTLLTEIDLSQNLLLSSVQIINTSITSLNISGLDNLWELIVINTQITTLDASNSTIQRINVSANSQLTNLNLTGLSTLFDLDCNNNALLVNLDLSTLTGLIDLECSENQLTMLNFSNCPLLTFIFCPNNQLTTLDVSNCPNLSNLYCALNPITSIFAKNGSTESLTFFSTDLAYICVDESQIMAVQAQLLSSGFTDAVASSYCSFTPGGNYNTISGAVRLDLNADGCDLTDAGVNFVRIGINDGSGSGTSFTNISGNYTFYTQTGNFTLTPELENSSYFTFSPTNTMINFPLIDNSVSVNDLCITTNGIHPDVEVVIAPIGGASPGFDASYKIVYKNKGNQILTGTLTFAFDDTILDFLSSAPLASAQAVNLLTFNYSNLYPFENREILITMNVNAPTDTPPVNINDALNFTATINPLAGDETSDDNTFTLNQTVVGSYDPNDITCLEGDTEPVTEIGEYLHYIIKFENTGTAPAQNIVVADMINTADFDLSSLQIMNSSHPMEAKITGNKVEFIFEGINLPSRYADPIGGHGNVLFKIKTLNTLTVGAVAENEADIFFDYNFPIETNLAQTTFQLLTNTDFIKDESVSFYPNPANDFVKIEAAGNIKSIQLFDIQGRILQTSIENKDAVTIDISAKRDGIYFIKVATDKGSKVEKIVKE